MTPELFWLTMTALLAATMWLPFIIGATATNMPIPENRPPDIKDAAPWVHRAWRAHLNLLEQFLPFAVIVLVAHLAGVSTPVTATAAMAFFGIRVVHAVWMIAGLPVLPVRPILFTLGWVAICVIGGAILLA